MSRIYLLCIWSSGFVEGAPHHGAYIDSQHYIDSSSFAGMRYIAEGVGSEKHVLKMVGSDDGKTWWTLQGTCSGPGMATITFDFSPKGGPSSLVGTASTLQDGSAQILWPDGNAWKRVETPPRAVETTSHTSSQGSGESGDPSIWVVASIFASFGVGALCRPVLARSVQDRGGPVGGTVYGKGDVEL